MNNEETIFTEALAKASASDRVAYLDVACAGDASLRRSVEELLAAHARAAGILEAPLLGARISGTCSMVPKRASQRSKHHRVA